jgi:hypothetical protein
VGGNFVIEDILIEVLFFLMIKELIDQAKELIKKIEKKS